MKKTKPTKPMTPFALSFTWQYLERAIDSISESVLGYKESEKTRLMNCIVRLSLILRKNPKSKEAQKELNDCLDRYSKKYDWLYYENL